MKKKRFLVGGEGGGKANPARTGQEYITALKERPREVWIRGERVKEVTTHPAFRNGVRSVAARERAKLCHLAWNITGSSFGGRQVLYERYFGGDPVRNSMLLYDSYDTEPFMQRVREFLHSPD